MHGIHVGHFRRFVVRPTLLYLGLHSQAAENLLIGTALTESRLMYLRQLGNGPARGVYQCEPATLNDIYDNYLSYRNDLLSLVDNLRDARETTEEEELDYNMAFASAIARIHYLRVPDALPAFDDPVGMARYHKLHYNTHLGATDTAESRHWFGVACNG